MEKQKQNTFRLFTDGACSGNPGPGGWASVLLMATDVIVHKGFETETTNNRMELEAAAEGILQSVEMVIKSGKLPAHIEVNSDSAYVVNSVRQGWVDVWRSNGWKTSKGSDVKNKDLWEKLDRAFKEASAAGVTISFVKVKGHDGNYFNEMADEAARMQAVKAKEILSEEG